MANRCTSFLGLFLLVACLCACGIPPRITFVPKPPAQVSPRPQPCDVDVFRDSKPERSYVEIGRIDYHEERHRAGGDRPTLDTVLPALKTRACEVGADALVNLHVTDERYLEYATFHISAVAVRYVRQ